MSKESFESKKKKKYGLKKKIHLNAYLIFHMSMVRGKDTDCLSKATFIAKVRDIANSANVAENIVLKFPQFYFFSK